jgi:AcrR family transcriptional regulator
MIGTVKARTYDSSRRQEQARRTRAAILDVAREMFLGRGYAATTMGDIADAADVSVETLYKGFGNKPGLLKALVDVAIVGDEEPVPMLERDQVAHMQAERDPRRIFATYGEHLARSLPRHVPLQLVIRAAAGTDTGAAELLEKLNAERLIGMTAFARHLRDAGHLRRARDILWTYNSAELFELLVLQRGWTAKAFARFVTDALIDALL